MVSTRQMSIINGGVNECTNQNVDYGPARFTRNSSVATEVAQYLESQPAETSTTEQPVCYRVTRQNSMHCGEASTSGSRKVAERVTVNLLDLPQEIIEKCLGFLHFKNVCQLRLVCKTFDSICGQVLNSTFQKLQAQMLNRFQAIKSKMPRRESARRNHHLACESDIIETLHMRLTLLQMSFGKHIERKHCCFFPGEILDEVHNILHYIKVTPKLSRPYKVTDELFDLSTMAMEYFKEKIEPELPEIAYFGTDFLDFTGTFSSSGTNKYLALDSSPLGPEEAKETDRPSCDILDNEEPLPQSNMVLRKRIRKIKQGMKRYNSQLSLLKQDLRTCKRKTAEQQKQIAEQQKQLAEQQKQTLDYANRLDEYDKKNEEISRKFSTLLQELNKCKTELQYWRSKSPATPPFCSGCGNIMLAPPDDLEALVNQGVIPGESEPVSDFIPIASTSSDNIEDILDHEKCENLTHTEEQAPVETIPKNAKRKLEDPRDTPTSAPSSSTKSRRIQKNRSKRVKL